MSASGHVRKSCCKFWKTATSPSWLYFQRKTWAIFAKWCACSWTEIKSTISWLADVNFRTSFGGKSKNFSFQLFTTFSEFTHGGNGSGQFLMWKQKTMLSTYCSINLQKHVLFVTKYFFESILLPIKISNLQFHLQTKSFKNTNCSCIEHHNIDQLHHEHSDKLEW